MVGKLIPALMPQLRLGLKYFHMIVELVNKYSFTMGANILAVVFTYFTTGIPLCRSVITACGASNLAYCFQL